ncbi:hypothetical protein GKJPGBOP_05470 [Streptomyces paromomycinus]|uniref:Uncharacterized protein n=1 Tax=Streptomyces paromomycinus TaxID=92743 RepID=A0A401W8U9_STREY|nr:hypothetical protein GKJPGBOP_05470 [Streptomyces paromomycinus]
METDGKLLTNFTVVVLHNVPGVGVGAYNTFYDHHDSGLFFDFPHDRLRDVFAYLVTTTRQGPQIVISLVDK